MTHKQLFLVFLAALLYSCQQEYHLSKIEGHRLEINDSLATNEAIDSFIKPYRESVDKDMNAVLSYARETYTKSDGELNTAIGNLMADAVFSEVNPIFNKRTGHDIDFVLLNHGGIRSIISQGNVSTRTAFEIMPFENEVVVIRLKGQQIFEMINYLSKAKRAHPLSHQFQLQLDADFNIIKATIKGEPITADSTYYVATNDYLSNGGDSMTFFQSNDSIYVMNYKVRNVLIDYFKKTDTLDPKEDNRFIRIIN